MTIKERTRSFMAAYRMDADHIDMDAFCASFVDQMSAGLAGRESSLPMLPTYLRTDNKLPIKEKVIVIDAGGSNLRVALAWFDQNSKPVFDNISLYKMPGSVTPTDRKTFYQTVAGHLKPYLRHSSKIGFCFSYATEIQPNHDGRLLRLSKEVTVNGLEGDLIGENLLQTIAAHGDQSERSIVILNDTAACLLGGAFSNADRVFEGYIGLIMGTGNNTCYVENTSAIGKIKAGFCGKSMVVNLESGCFDKFPRGVIDEEVDQASSNPGDHVFEKMVAGHYQGYVFQRLLIHAIEDGLFSRKRPASEINALRIGARDIDNFLNYPYDNNINLFRFLTANGINADDNDRAVLYFMIDAMIERTALMITANLSAILDKTGHGQNPCRPVCVTADGSTFYKSKLFRDKLSHYVRIYMNEQKGQYCEFIKVENGNLIGTAAAGLQNWR